MSVLTKSVNSLLSPLGVHLRRNDVTFDEGSLSHGLARLAHQGVLVNTIVDVGASNGCWSRTARSFYPKAHVLAFEPLEEHGPTLTAIAKEDVSFHYIAAAAGAQSGVVQLNVSEDLDGSGIYGRGGRLRDVALRTIDQEAHSRQLRGPFLVKLDTHGYELPILEGAHSTLALASAVIIEVYAHRLASSSPLFFELCTRMEALGFQCSDILDVLRRPGDKAFWQADFVFQPKSAPVFQMTRYR